MVKLQLAQFDLNHLTVQSGRCAIVREDCHLCRLCLPLLGYVDSLASGRLLAVVYLAQIQNLSLHDSATMRAPVLDDAPIAVLLSVLETILSA